MPTNDRDAFVMRRIVPYLTCLLLAWMVMPAHAQDLALPQNPLEDPDRWLSEERWSEVRYGLSIREPHNPVRVADTAQGDVMRWALEGGIRIRLSFARGAYEGFDGRGQRVKMPAKVGMLKKQISDEMNLAVAGKVINTRADQVIEVGELGGVINYFVIKPNAKRVGDYLFGIALLQLDPMSVAVLKLECPPESISQAVSTFECMAHSIKTQNAKDANRRMHGWLSNGEDLLNTITQKDRQQAMRGDQLYRVLEDGKDLGYVRIWQRFQDEAHYEALKRKNIEQGGNGRLAGINRFEATGNAVIVQTRIQANARSMERLYEAIDDVNGTDEYWQFKSTLLFDNDPTNRRAGAWAETGIRGIATIGGEPTDHIRLTQEGTPPRHMVDFLLARERDPNRRLRYPSADPRSYPSGDLKEKAWPTPKRAFLSVVDAALMPALLPNEKKTYAFSAYHLEASRIDIRLMRVEPNPNGGKTVYLRPILDLSEQKLVFDRNNEMVSRTFPDGRELRRTTRQELAQIWGVRLRD